MPPDDPTPSHPLLKVYHDIGKITAGIANLEKGQEKLGVGQEGVEKKISGLHQTVADLVTKNNCDSFRAEFKGRVEGVAACAGAAKAAAKKTGLFSRAAANAGDISKIMTLVAALVIGMWAAHKFAIRVESALDRADAKQVQTTKQLMHSLDKPRKPHIVYVPITVHPDAGARQRVRLRRRATPR